RPSGGRDLSPGRRAALRDRGGGRGLLSGRGRARAVQAHRPGGRRGEPTRPAARRRRHGPGGSPAARARRADRELPRLATRRRDRPALRALPRPHLPGGRGLRDHAARGRSRRAPDDRARAGRRARDDGGARRRRRAADRRVLPGPIGRRARRGDLAIRARRRPVRRQGAALARRVVRPAGLQTEARRLHRRALGRVPGGGGMLKAHSRLVENLALAGDLFLIAICWVESYWIRFHLVPRFHLMSVTDVPPFRDYALQLVPILMVWGIAFRTFDLYRPNRLGSRRSEWWDVAKASTVGALVLVSIMTFVFRGHEYSRLVILLFLAQSIVVVSLARAGLREALRFARRHGYNLRYAIGGGG